MLTRGLSLTTILIYLLLNAPVQASSNTMFHTMKPELVYALTVQADDGADYHQYAYVSDDLGFCDVSRPAAVRDCQVDLRSITNMFRRLTVVSRESALPPSIQWEAWDWNTMTIRDGGYTPVILSAQFNEWNPDTEQTHYWWLACSILPENQNLAACKEVDYWAAWSSQIINVDFADQAEIGYFVIRADGLLAIHQSVFPDSTQETAGASDGPQMSELVDNMYG